MGQDNRIEKLETRIKILEAQLQEAQSHTYIGETDTLSCILVTMMKKPL